jgi:RNA polymerase sigma-70 factor (ECF subfamily)
LSPSLTRAPDVVLAELAAGGNRDAFAELVRRSIVAVRSLLRRMGAQPALADDVTQEAFITAFRKVTSYRAESSFAAWVMRIAARLCVKRFRREARMVLSLEAETPAPLVDAHVPDPSLLLDLGAALEALSPAERLCVSLCHGAGFTHAEISSELQIPLGTVKSHVLRGTRKLRLRLGSDGTGQPHKRADQPGSGQGTEPHEPAQQRSGAYLSPRDFEQDAPTDQDSQP